MIQTVKTEADASATGFEESQRLLERYFMFEKFMKNHASTSAATTPKPITAHIQ